MGQSGSKIWNNIFPPPPAPDSETRKEIRTERDAFYTDLKNFQKKVKDQLDSQYISPDSAKELNTVISTAQEWLRNNPNANVIEVKAQRDDIEEKARPIYERDKSRTLLDTFLVAVNFNVENGYKSGLYDKPKYKSATATVSSAQSWLKKHRTEDGITYTQKLEDVKNQLSVDLSIPKDDLSKIQTEVVNAKPSVVKESIKTQKTAQTVKESNEFSTNRLFKNMLTTATGVFFSFILFLIILFGGSLCANMAIGRDIHYRIFYFIFGCIPWITPFVYIYAALLSLRGESQSIRYYGVLPVSTEPAKTYLGKILWWPFYYETDAYEVKKKEEFLESLQNMASLVLATPKPAPATL